MIILTYNTSHICEKHTFTRYYASYVFHLWFVHNKPFLMNSEKRQEIMLLFTPVRQRKIITSRSILTIPIGIRMNFARGLSVMADGFTRIIRKSNFPPNPKRSVRKSSFHIKRSVLKTINAQHQKCNQKKVAFLVSTNRLKQALKWHSNISRKPLLSQQKCVSLFSVKPPYYRKFHPAFYTTLCLCTWQNSSCAH